MKKANKKLREPAVAGQFYPSDKAELELMIKGFFKKAESPKLGGNIRALIVPHAGYVYSGQVAAYAYKALQNQKISRVVLIGNSHQEYFDGISVYESGYFRTPLGDIEIDEDFAKRLIDSNPKIKFYEKAHLQEHSLEVQLPFLQRVFSAQGGPASGWKIVPIILGNQTNTVDILTEALKNLIDENTLIIASSDLSHYPSYKDAQYSDGEVIKAILTGKRENLRKTISDLEKENIPNLQTCACGADAIEVVMGLFGNKNIKLLNSANSGDITGDHLQVVGYASIVFIDSELGEIEQKTLLDFARQAVETYVKTGKIIEVEENNPNLNQHRGAFVTLQKNGELRGCIGIFPAPEGRGLASGGEPLYKTVIDMAISAAIHDPRFNPVAINELKDLKYEISVLSPLEKVDSWKDVEIGKHGVEIVKNSRKGVFLPQVATENNWDEETFLSILCSQKAGLSADCYKDKNTEIYVFTAQIFGDKNVK
jgi:hypothetical protein